MQKLTHIYISEIIGLHGVVSNIVYKMKVFEALLNLPYD